MKKDNCRDYTTEAFRFYAEMGKPTFEMAKKLVYLQAVRRLEHKNPQEVMIIGERAIRDNTAMLLDIYAVDKTLELLRFGGRDYIAKAVEEVYFANPRMALRRGDITARVRRYCRTCHADERTVYRWLKDARQLFAYLRGMRVNGTK